MNVEDTLDLLLENPKSFCRYGDGEFFITFGQNIGFQEYDKKLAERLCEILQSKDDKCYIGIDHRYFYMSTSDMIEYQKNDVRKMGHMIRPAMLRYCNRKKLYITSIFSCFYMTHNHNLYEYQIHFNKVKELFRGRNLVIFTGKSVFDNITHNVFEYADDIKWIFTESRNAWSHYEEIMTAARQFSKDWILCFILGPTATVLAYDLAQEGYTAWDIGHIAKDYDAFMKGIIQTVENNKKFFSAD